MIYYRSGYKYQLAERYSVQTDLRPADAVFTDFITLRKDGRLSVYKGYAWDGPSGPAIDTANFMRGSLVHDALYQLMRMGLLAQGHREAADLELWRICREDGMWRPRAAWVYRGVRLGAGPAASPESRKPILTAGASPDAQGGG